MTLNPIDLPEIPTLPPIQMPDASHFEPSSPVSAHSVLSMSRRASPSPFASQDTFRTAQSSPASDMNGLSPSPSHDYLRSSSPHSSATSTSLRKSLSVDSFVKAAPSNHFAHGNTLNSSSEHVPDLANSTLQHVSVSGSSRPSATRHRAHPAASRSRGTSLSTAVDNPEESFFDGSDLEWSDDPPRPLRQGKVAGRRVIPPGELVLPSRLQSVSSYPSMNTSPTSYSNGNSSPIVPVRSSSLSHRLSKQKSHMVVNTHPMPPSKPSEITLAVVGAMGCGKSTVIKKGLKGYNLSEPYIVGIPGGPSGTGEDVFTYTYRTGRIFCQNASDRHLRVIEVDISDFDLSQIGKQEMSRGTPLDGIIVCYDAGQESSFRHVEDILRQFAPMKLPTVVFACKSDQEKRVSPGRALSVLQEYDVGLIEVSNIETSGKEKMRTAFDWIFRAILALQDGRPTERDGYSNPASPAVLTNTAPWDISRASSATPTASSSAISSTPQARHTTLPVPIISNHTHILTQISMPTSITPTRPTQSPSQSRGSLPSTPTSPTRARSTSDLYSEHEKSKRDGKETHVSSRSVAIPEGMHNHSPLHTQSVPVDAGETTVGLDGPQEALRESSVKEPRAPPWMTLDDLLNKLLFMSVSDDDPVFISHFLLTYRRFASPRSVLLAMQKRMRSLDQPSGDPMFACFAQMRICLLLDNWIKEYPHDFAVPGASSALAAFVKSVLTKTYLLHYGSDFLPFLELLSSYHDYDKAWALKVDYPTDETDDSSSQSDEEQSPFMRSESPGFSNKLQLMSFSNGSHSATNSTSQITISRERKSSLPLTSKSFSMNSSANPASAGLSDGSGSDRSPKAILKRLASLSQELSVIDPGEIAQELTKLQLKLFLQIKPRHWLQHVFVQGKKDPETDPIAKYSTVSNHIADWVVSLILCHDKPKGRARQIEKFVEVANRLRTIDNYSGLRAVIAGINSATFDGDPSLELLKTRSHETWKTFQSWDQLLQSVRSHQKYRMALRNSKGACIPALEIHLSDLIRAHEGNADFYGDDPTKIHWAKFNMMGRFIDTITSCQNRCLEAPSFGSSSNSAIVNLLLFDKADFLMDYDMQRSRIAPPDIDGGEDAYKPGLPRTYSRDAPLRDAAILRRIFFW